MANASQGATRSDENLAESPQIQDGPAVEILTSPQLVSSSSQGIPSKFRFASSNFMNKS